MSGLDEQFPVCSCSKFWGWRLKGRANQLNGWVFPPRDEKRIFRQHGIVHLANAEDAVIRETQTVKEFLKKFHKLQCHECESWNKDVNDFNAIRRQIILYWDVSRSYRSRLGGRYIMKYDEERRNADM